MDDSMQRIGDAAVGQFEKIFGGGRAEPLPGDYFNADGLLMCGKCHTLKEFHMIRDYPAAHFDMILPVMCKCAKEEAAKQEAAQKYREDMEALERMRKNGLVDTALTQARFENFEERDENRRALLIAKQYCDYFDEMIRKNRGLLFYGPPGTGKTYTAACIANELIDRRISVLMTSFVKFNGSTSFDDDDESMIARMRRAKLLIIDDLGAERSTEYALERVYNVIDSRVRSNLPMILTTNLTMTQMRETFNMRLGRIYDRVFQFCYPVEFKGVSRRQSAAKHLYDEMNELFGISDRL